MTDLEMTKLCAEAMALPLDMSIGEPMFHSGQLRVLNEFDIAFGYDPLHDDAQAMALVKKFVLLNDWHPKLKLWSISARIARKNFEATSPDLNRAIVECVAKMQKAAKHG